MQANIELGRAKTAQKVVIELARAEDLARSGVLQTNGWAGSVNGRKGTLDGRKEGR